MTALEYYKTDFGRDLQLIGVKDRISIVSLLPAEPSSRQATTSAAVEFQKLDNKVQFLQCYFFSALLDQAVHSASPNEHIYFEGLARYPKLCGILGSYWSILHPALLLLAATLYLTDDNRGEASKDIEELATFFADDYVDFFTRQYPRLKGRWTSPAEQTQFLTKLYSEISTAVAYLFSPVSLKPYCDIEPDLDLYTDWMFCISGKMNSKYEYWTTSSSD